MARTNIFDRLSGFFILQWGWKRTISAFAAGGLSALAMPPADMFWVLFLTLPVLVWLIDGTAGDPARGIFATLGPSFKIGWWFAFGYFLFGLWWIGAALLVEAETFAWMVPIAVLGIPAFLALFWAAFIAIARLFWSEDWKRIVILSAAIAIAEYLRANILTGFPWNSIGYAAMPNALMMQSASVLGVYGITPLALLVFSSPAIFAPASTKASRRVRLLLICALGICVAHISFGAWRLASNPPSFKPDIKIRIVQPAIAQQDKWEPENEADIFGSYISLSQAQNGGVTHYVWPESAFPFVLTQRRDALAAIANLLPQDTYLITGAMRVENALTSKDAPKIFNSVYVINHKGEIAGAADKSHLVPFGEYLPFQELAESLGLQQITGIDGGFTPGNSRVNLSTKTSGIFIPLVCYEIIFSGNISARKLLKNSSSDSKIPMPEWIVNVTNDAWFGKSSGPYQHHRQAVIRGVEEGLPIIRAANSGISSGSDAYGRITGKLKLGERGIIDVKLPYAAPATLFSRFGNAGFFLIIGAMLLISIRRITI